MALTALFAAGARAEDRPVKISRQWTGSVADAALARDAPTCIASAKQLETLWTLWKLGGKVPAVDFTKEIVVLATTPGSRIKLTCALSDAGNLQLLGLATADFGEGFRYVIAAVSRDEVKTVDGKELPKD